MSIVTPNNLTSLVGKLFYPLKFKTYESDSFISAGLAYSVFHIVFKLLLVSELIGTLLKHYFLVVNMTDSKPATSNSARLVTAKFGTAVT